MRYDLLSDRVLDLNFDFEEPEFVVSPLYPIFLALIKLVSGSHWIAAQQVANSILSAVETVVLFGIARLLWNDRRVSVLAALGHSVYPPGLIYVPVIGQEPLFETMWVLSIYWLIRSVKDGTYRAVAISALFFGLGYLTKSHILLFPPFICAYYLLNVRFTDSVKRIVLFGAISFAMSIPWGIYNWISKGNYILSASGYGSHFLGAHNDDYYKFVFDPPPLGSSESRRLIGWTGYHVFQEMNTKRELTGMTDKEFQKSCYELGMSWVRQNPEKCFWLKVHDMIAMLRPGVSRRHYPFRIWLASFVICTPVFVLAFAGIVRNLRSDFRLHFWILGVFLAMSTYAISFYLQARFRACTIEAFYLIYFAFMVDFIWSRAMGSRGASNPEEAP